jgi:hypothetical protein
MSLSYSARLIFRKSDAMARRSTLGVTKRDWEEMTPHIEFVVNNQTKDTLTGLAPTKVELGIVPVLNT